MVNMSTKWKVLLLILSIPLIAMGTVRVKDSLKKPSEEILRLRQIENRLSLPAPQRRNEHDTGCYRSPLGTARYSRYISLYYKDLETAKKTKGILEASHWDLTSSDSFENGLSYGFENKIQDASVYIKLELDTSSIDTFPHYVAIKALTEDKCEFLP